LQLANSLFQLPEYYSIGIIAIKIALPNLSKKSLTISVEDIRRNGDENCIPQQIFKICFKLRTLDEKSYKNHSLYCKNFVCAQVKAATEESLTFSCYCSQRNLPKLSLWQIEKIARLSCCGKFHPRIVFELEDAGIEVGNSTQNEQMLSIKICSYK